MKKRTKIKTTRTPVTHCSMCGSKLDCASGRKDYGPPREGDFSVCLNCGAVGCFTADLTVRGPLTPPELAAIPADLWIRIDRLKKAIYALPK
jgi:hypothetical protein